MHSREGCERKCAEETKCRGYEYASIGKYVRCALFDIHIQKLVPMNGYSCLMKQWTAGGTRGGTGGGKGGGTRGGT